MSGAATVHPLHGNQMKAVRPDDTVWLSASAGTGKTQVLSARVLRLLLQPGVEPSQILCLTFTKAGAAEMASRINDQLARWVRLDDAQLAVELSAIGADVGPKSRDRARTLFASVLDCPGGGLRIDTIHAFAQWLLATFPHEAGLSPGTRAMEDRDRALLLREVLADLLVQAETDPIGDPELIEAVEQLSLRIGPDAVEAFLLRCADAREAWFGAGSWQSADMRDHVNRLLGLPVGADNAMLAAMCDNANFASASLQQCCATLAAWDSKTGRDGAAAITSWLAADNAGRADGIDALYAALFTKSSGEPRQLANILKREPGYETPIAAVGDAIRVILEFRALLGLAERLVPALRLGRAFAVAWDGAKLREGLIDFDDQIRQAARLLGQSDLSEWIRYKMDRRFDHILVDEAQDTNAAQWRIIDALTGEFFVGEGQRGDVMRTLFVVGDYKQAIFRFQGTSPENFEKARQRVWAAMAGAAENAVMLRSKTAARPLRELGLDQSFRTAQPVLDFVDRAIAQVGHARLGLAGAPDRHSGQDRPGHVSLWRPVGAAGDDGDEALGGGEDDAEGWLARPDRQMAENVASQVRRWIDDGLILHKGKRRQVGPGDIMVLVRKRKDLAGLIVARLHSAGVPVAGVDRLRLGAPLAVRDLAATLRFAAQPFDDLNLAALLVSPLGGWSQEQLLAHAVRPDRVRLWAHLRASRDPDVAAMVAHLSQLLRLADFEPPQALLHWILSGPWQGRRKLVARLGHEANDPIDELINAAHAYATSDTPSLVGFLNWFDAGDGELKREAGVATDLVRVMTVHGSKGLQAPIVILADATGDPAAGYGPAAELSDPLNPERKAPLPGIRKEERVGRLADQFAEAQLAEDQEHWRLLYVAMTRAEEALFIGGALGPRDRGEPAEGSWFAHLRQIFGADEWVDDPVWGGRLDWGDPLQFERRALRQAALDLAAPLPGWLNALPAPEARPPKPLAPSRLGEDESPDPPFPPGAGKLAARRGVLIHGLLERLPDVSADLRAAAGAKWLLRNAPDLDEAAREDLLGAALTVLENPAFADVFAPGGLAEVPIVATLGTKVLAGTIDRLLVRADCVMLVDYKTARRPPADVSGVPTAIQRQMAAYVGALEKAYPGRPVRAALLYTAAPRLIELPADLMETHKQALLAEQ